MCPEQNVSESRSTSGHVVVAIDEEDGGRFLVGHERCVEPLHGVITPCLGELGVRVTRVAGHGVVEEAELLAVSVALVTIDGRPSRTLT